MSETDKQAMILSKDEVAAIMERLRPVTPGPWLYDPEESEVYFEDADIPCLVAELQLNSADDPSADGIFIAHARTDIPRLIATVEQLDRENQELRAKLCPSANTKTV